MPKVVTICQPRYLPYLGFFDRILKSDLFIVLDHVQFASGGWENRNKIRAGNATQLLTVPVDYAPKGTPISEIMIDNTKLWRQKHWASIEQNYRKATHYSNFGWQLISLYGNSCVKPQANSLMTLNLKMMQKFFEWLDIETPWIASSQIISANSRLEFGKGSVLLMNLCSAVGADVYFSGAPGRNYLNETLFNAVNIKVQYQDYDHPVYPQLGEGFIPNLSVVDLLLNCGYRSKDIIRNAQLP